MQLEPHFTVLFCNSWHSMDTPTENQIPPDISHQNEDTGNESTVMITANTAFDGYKLRNFYMTNAFQ